MGAASSGIGATWDSAAGQFDNFKTLSYGYAGSEPAIYAAAHMAANMADLADADATPGAWTLLLNNAAFNTVSTSTLFHPWAESVTGAVMAGDSTSMRRLGSAVVARRVSATAGTGGSLVVPAANIYGVEPQPFVTAVATFTVYTPTGPRRRLLRQQPRWVDPGDPGATPEEVDIRPDVSEFNYDFLYRVVAFRVHNPFSGHLTLGDPRAIFNLTDPTSAQTACGQPARYRRCSRDVAGSAEGLLLPHVGRPHVHVDGAGEEADPSTGDYAAAAIGGGLDITAQRLTIKAGALVVCYATSQIPRTIIERNFLTADPGFVVSGGNKRAVIRGLIERQFLIRGFGQSG